MLGTIREAVRRRRARRADRRQRTVGKHMVWRDQPFFVAARAAHGHVAGIPDLRLFVLQSFVRSIPDVPGDIAECGTRNGKSALFMLDALDGTERRMVLFDSFEGLSDPTPGQDTLASAFDPKTGERHFHQADPQVVVDRFRDRPVDVMTGWIPDRFPEVADRRFALVHVDVDLYQPTLDSLAFLFPRLAPFGVLICDDYGSGAYPGARKAMDEYFADRPEGIVELPTGQAFVVKRG